MPVTILRYESKGAPAWGVVNHGNVTPIPGNFATTGDFIRCHTPTQLRALKAKPLTESALEILSPVTQNQQFICQGANYRQHMIESGMNPDAKHYNMMFTKASSCIVAANHDVIRPARATLLDYEIELGLIIKRPITRPVRVTDDNLHDFIAGLVIVNDYSARDVQIPQMQFYKGKSYRSFGPVGPYLVLLEPQDMPQLKQLRLQLRVNGEVRQDDTSANMVYAPAETLTELSGIHDLHPGDLLATGTPSGCALALPSPAKQRIAALLPETKKWALFQKMQARRSQYLHAGDLVEASIRSADGSLDLGTQRNRVVDAEGLA